MEKSEAFLWKEKISKLLSSFSIPCIISFLVNALYNIVDQIFIGRWIWYLANWATNIVFPLTMICLWCALLFWDWAASFLSIKLWEKKNEEAAKWVATWILMTIIISLIFSWLTLVFLPEILTVFWCTETLRPYATTYGWIITLWIPFFMVWIALNSIIRAEWNPKFAMISMIIGAVINIILDPLFIFVFNRWIAWAAYATIISQFITFWLNIWFILKLKTIKLTTKLFKPELYYIKKTAWLWISSMINQISIVFVIAVTNNLLAKYGAVSKYWSEIPITVIGIVMKIAMILNSIILWISVGSQPIVWYNYWARKFNRVKEALKLVLTSCSIIWLIAFILFQTIPEYIISIFGAGNELYIEFACLAFRIYLLFCIWYWIQIPAWIFFQSIWKSRISAFLSLSRQIILLIPLFFILWSIFWIMWILYAWACADCISIIIAISFLVRETKILWKRHKEETEEKEYLYTCNNTSLELFATIETDK